MGAAQRRCGNESHKRGMWDPSRGSRGAASRAALALSFRCWARLGVQGANGPPGSWAPAALGAPASAEAPSLRSEESEASALHFAGVLFGFVFAVGMDLVPAESSAPSSGREASLVQRYTNNGRSNHRHLAPEWLSPSSKHFENTN